MDLDHLFVTVDPNTVNYEELLEIIKNKISSGSIIKRTDLRNEIFRHLDCKYPNR